MRQSNLVKQACQVLESNWNNGFTIPTSNLYPFQWNWDSGFTCLGHSHYKIERAIQEFQFLFAGQWQNGMLPHIVFHSENETTYFPNFDFWNCNVNTGAPRKPKTSGITQPPVHAFILEALLERFPTNDTLSSFANLFYDRLLDCHRWFYNYRDPNREGLVYIFHPWESGRDNSPLWDYSMDRITVDKGKLPYYKRKDTDLASADERPTSNQYDRYVYLLELGKKYKYDGIQIFEESPFLIQDTLINAVLIKSNKSLINMGNRFGKDVGQIIEWQQQAKQTFNDKLWHEGLSTFVVYDLRHEKTVDHKEIGGLTSLIAEVPNQTQVNKLNDYLLNLHNRGFYLCPSFDVDDELFDSKRYWRGPIWPQMNWLIHQGLKTYGFESTAQLVRSDIISLITQFGFYEYFEAQKTVASKLKHGYGGNNFSWTAACFLDLFLQERNYSS